MNGRKKFRVAAIMAALIVSGCRDATGPEPPPPVERLTLSITCPVDGSRVNETVPPETPVQLCAKVAPRDATVVWREGERVFGSDTLLAVSFLPGFHRVEAKATARDDSLVKAVGFTIRPDFLAVTIVKPQEGQKFREDRAVPCEYAVTQDPVRDQIRNSVSVNGQAASCENGVLVPPASGSPPAGLRIGENTLVVRAAAEGRNLVAADTVRFEITPKPGYLLFTDLRPGDVGESYIVEENDPTTLRRLPPTNAFWVMLSPDSTKLTYVRWGEYCGGRTPMVHVANANGTGERVIGIDANGQCQVLGSARSPYFSPDGRKLAFVAAWGYPAGPGLRFTPFLASADGSSLRVIPSATCQSQADPGPCLDEVRSEIVYHPDGAKLVYFHREELGAETSRVVGGYWDLNSERYVRIFEDQTFQSGNAIDPIPKDVSPDGKLVVVTSFRDVTAEGFRLALLKLDGSGFQPFSVNPQPRGRWPAFTVDGKHICYVAGERRRVIRCINLDGSLVWQMDFTARLSGEIVTIRRHPVFPPLQ